MSAGIAAVSRMRGRDLNVRIERQHIRGRHGRSRRCRAGLRDRDIRLESQHFDLTRRRCGLDARRSVAPAAPLAPTAAFAAGALRLRCGRGLRGWQRRGRLCPRQLFATGGAARLALRRRRRRRRASVSSSSVRISSTCLGARQPRFFAPAGAALVGVGTADSGGGRASPGMAIVWPVCADFGFSLCSSTAIFCRIVRTWRRHDAIRQCLRTSTSCPRGSSRCRRDRRAARGWRGRWRCARLPFRARR